MAIQIVLKTIKIIIKHINVQILNQYWNWYRFKVGLLSFLFPFMNPSFINTQILIYEANAVEQCNLLDVVMDVPIRISHLVWKFRGYVWSTGVNFAGYAFMYKLLASNSRCHPVEIHSWFAWICIRCNLALLPKPTLRTNFLFKFSVQFIIATRRCLETKIWNSNNVQLRIRNIYIRNLILVIFVLLFWELASKKEAHSNSNPKLFTEWKLDAFFRTKTSHGFFIWDLILLNASSPVMKCK